MRLIRLILCVPISFLLSFSLAAQQTATSSPQALAFLQKSLAALGGGQALADVTVSGTARRIAGSDDESGTAVFKALASGASRIDLAVPSGPRSEIRSVLPSGPSGGWSGPDGVVHQMPYHNVVTDTGLLPLFTIASILSKSTSVLTFIGAETRNGQSVVHLSAVQQFPSLTGDGAALLQHLSKMDIYLDATTNFPASLVFNIHPDNNALLDIPVELRFSDYRAISGSQIPFHIEKYINNSLTLDLQFQSATLNTGLTAAQVRAQ